MRIFIRILIVICILFIVGIIAISIFLTIGLKTNKELTINPVDLSTVKDGTYIGSYGTGRWANKVKVIVKDKEITSVEVTKTVLFENADVTKKLLDEVIAKQNVDVDTISGATATSKCYLKSIETALTK